MPNPAPRPRERLPRARRLLRRRDYLATQGSGRRVGGTHFMITWRKTDVGGKSRIGITVSSKVGIAVVRNRVKRWVRESTRRLAARWPEGTDFVVIARPSSAGTSYATTFAELSSLLGRLTGRPEGRSA